MRKLPPLERLQELFVHDPETGFVYKKVGSANKDGYTYLHVDGAQYPLHRIIWKLAHGEDPDGMIDHVNGDHSDNALSNLRVVSHWKNKGNE